MTISCNNIREIENINLHDAYIENVIYNHSNKVINVELESEWEKTDYDLSFHEVLYYEMTCCDFWGCGYNVICWSKFDTTEIFDKLLRIDRIEKAESNSESNTIMDLSEYIGIDILLNSGAPRRCASGAAKRKPRASTVTTTVGCHGSAASYMRSVTWRNAAPDFSRGVMS